MFGGSMMAGFDNDPFFAEHQQHMQRMNAMLQNPFGNMGMQAPFMAVTDGRGGREQERDRQRRGQRHRSNEIAVRDPFNTGDMFGDMFGNMNRMMSNMRNMMQDMHKQSEPMISGRGVAPAAAPGGNFYSQSTVMTYSSDGQNQPKVYQATTSTRQTGGVKETRKTVRDSEKGIEKMSIGHHIGERAHIISKEKNRRTGQVDEEQELLNLDEEEVGNFDQEWRHKTRQHSQQHRRLDRHDRSSGHRYERRRTPAIEYDHSHSEY